MKSYIKTSSVIWSVAILVVLLIGLYVANQYAPKAVMKYYVHTFKSAETSDGEQFEKLLRDGTYKLIQKESWGTKPYANKASLWKMVCPKSAVSVGGYGENALLMHYAFLYAEHKKDSDLMKLVQSKFDKFYRTGNVQVVRNDQIAYGNVALDLLRWTGDGYYRSFADKIYGRLDSIERTNGKVLYREDSRTQEVDAIGLVCPFLVNYGVATNTERSIEMAARMVADYILWGTDAVTGIPVQTYTHDKHIKCNKANWGRGIGWYLEGVEAVMSVDTAEFTVVAELLYRKNLHERVEVLKQTLLADEDRVFQQYYDQGNTPDMSATIPVLYYCYDGKLSKNELASLVSPYFENDGVVRFCSTSISYPQKSVNVTYTNLWTQGLSLYYCAKFSK